MAVEDETKEFLIRILQTISIVMLWMMLNVFFGFYKDYAFFDKHANWTNYLFYILSAASFIWLVIHLWRKWKL